MEELRFSYHAHSSSSSVCFTSTGENPLSSPWNSVSESQSAWLSWQNNPFSDHPFFGRHKIRMIWIMNPILDSPKETHPKVSMFIQQLLPWAWEKKATVDNIERNWKTNLFCINAHTRATLDRRIRYPQSHWDECCSQAFSFLHTWRPGLKYFSQTAIIILRDLSKMVLHVFQRCTFNAL